MTTADAIILLRRLRQAATQVTQCLAADEPDATALLKAAEAMSVTYHATISAVLALAYAEAGGVVVGDDKFSARIYEVPHGVGYDGKP